MKNIKGLIKFIVKNEDGGETVEYPSVLAAVVIIGIPTLIAIGAAVSALYSRISKAIDTI